MLGEHTYLSFLWIYIWMNEWINQSSVSRTTHPPIKTLNRRELSIRKNVFPNHMLKLVLTLNFSVSFVEFWAWTLHKSFVLKLLRNKFLRQFSTDKWWILLSDLPITKYKELRLRDFIQLLHWWSFVDCDYTLNWSLLSHTVFDFHFIYKANDCYSVTL